MEPDGLPLGDSDPLPLPDPELDGLATPVVGRGDSVALTHGDALAESLALPLPEPDCDCVALPKADTVALATGCCVTDGERGTQLTRTTLPSPPAERGRPWPLTEKALKVALVSTHESPELPLDVALPLTPPKCGNIALLLFLAAHCAIHALSAVARDGGFTQLPLGAAASVALDAHPPPPPPPPPAMATGEPSTDMTVAPPPWPPTDGRSLPLPPFPIMDTTNGVTPSLKKVTA